MNNSRIDSDNLTDSNAHLKPEPPKINPMLKLPLQIAMISTSREHVDLDIIT